MSTRAPDVVDREDEGRFVAVADGYEAELVYRRRGERDILVHTGVPSELEGRGIGSALVRAAIDHARREGHTLVPWCPFARQWITDHPEEVAGVAVDWSPPPGREP